jgi:hypothetical protein
MALQFNALQDLPSSGFPESSVFWVSESHFWTSTRASCIRDRPVARFLPTRDTANTRRMHMATVSRIRKHYTKLQVVEDSTCLELRSSCVWRNIISAIK